LVVEYHAENLQKIEIENKSIIVNVMKCFKIDFFSRNIEFACIAYENITARFGFFFVIIDKMLKL
jgi:hypothetical protein